MARFTKDTSYHVRVDKINDDNHDLINVENGAMHYVNDGINKGLWYAEDNVWKRIKLGDSSDSVDNLGWESWGDNFYTEQNPLIITKDTTAILTNNGNIIVNNHTPKNSTGLYDAVGNKITPLKEGDYMIMSFRFFAKGSTAFTYVEYSLDIGQAVLPLFPDGLIFPDTKEFPKGAGVEHPLNIVSNGYAGAEFTNNGGVPKITAVGGDVEIYNIEFQISIVNKGK
jgi:hypothetical protein